MKSKKPPGVNPEKLKQLQQRDPYGQLIKTIIIEDRLIGHGKIAGAGMAWVEGQNDLKAIQVEMSKTIEALKVLNQKLFQTIDEVFPEWKNNQKKYTHKTRTLQIFSKSINVKDN